MRGGALFYIVDPPPTASFASLNASGPVGTTLGGGAPASVASAPNAANSAYYFPWVLAPDPLSGDQAKLWPPCGFVAGVYAATGGARGVWKAPAGAAAALSGEVGLQYALTDIENGDLYSQGINCLRHFSAYGDVIWGARTLLGADEAGSQWKYVPVRRLALFLEIEPLRRLEVGRLRTERRGALEPDPHERRRLHAAAVR